MMGKEERFNTGEIAEGLVAFGANMVVPGLGAFAKPAIRALTQEHQRRRSVALRTAERISGLTREDFAERLEDDPASLSLLGRVLFTAGMTGHDEVLSLLGMAFGDAIRDSANIDDAETIMIALTSVTPRHLQLLRWLPAQTPVPLGFDSNGQTSVGDVVYTLPLPVDISVTCLGQLVGAGLASYVSLYGMLGITPTDLGATVVELSAELALLI